MDTEKILGYVICVNVNATDDNPNFAGVKEKSYLGRNYSYFGDHNFVPYASLKGAENAKKAWEKRFKHPAYNNGWKYIIGEVIPLNKQNIKKLEAETVAYNQKVMHNIACISLGYKRKFET